jgi:hypothetical protein
MNANNSSMEDPKKLKAELKEEKDENRKIEKELRSKEKVLAETAALLVLSAGRQRILPLKFYSQDVGIHHCAPTSKTGCEIYGWNKNGTYRRIV